MFVVIAILTNCYILMFTLQSKSNPSHISTLGRFSMT
eukprot:UN08097